MFTQAKKEKKKRKKKKEEVVRKTECFQAGKV